MRLSCLNNCTSNLIQFIFLWPDTKSIVQIDTLCRTQVNKNRQDNVLPGIEAGGITDFRHFLQLLRRQNHRVADISLTLMLANT